jgi:hypothetical protein
MIHPQTMSLRRMHHALKMELKILHRALKIRPDAGLVKSAVIALQMRTKRC